MKVEARVIVDGQVVEDWYDIEMILATISGYYSLVCDKVVVEFRRKTDVI